MFARWSVKAAITDASPAIFLRTSKLIIVSFSGIFFSKLNDRIRYLIPERRDAIKIKGVFVSIFLSGYFVVFYLSKCPNIFFCRKVYVQNDIVMIT